MTRFSNRLAALAFAFIASQPLCASDDIFVYPAKGQSDEQLGQDRYECHRWAMAETNFDPTQFADVDAPRVVRVPTPRNEAEGATAKGAITGAVAGGVIGAHDRDVGKGAVIGAVVGTIVGAAIEGQGESAAQASADAEARKQADFLAESKAERALRRANYQRALTACLEGRGYTVR